MKKLIIASLAFATIAAGLFSCQKSTTPPVAPQKSPVTAEQRTALASQFRSYYETHFGTAAAGKGQGSVFIAPFFSIEAWGFVKYDPATNITQLVFFAAELGDGDFYRENPDGTVSVHINSHNADIYYFPDLENPNGPLLIGTHGRYSSNYTGPVIDFGNGFKIIDTERLRNAAVSGSGKVSETGAAPWTSLLLKFLVNPGGRIETEFIVR